MPRKIDLENETPVKPKREITDAQREHICKNIYSYYYKFLSY